MGKTLSDAAARARGRHAITCRTHGADSPEARDTKRALAAARLEDHIRAIVAVAPPLTEDQVARLRLLLTAGGAK